MVGAMSSSENLRSTIENFGWPGVACEGAFGDAFHRVQIAEGGREPGGVESSWFLGNVVALAAVFLHKHFNMVASCR